MCVILFYLLVKRNKFRKEHTGFFIFRLVDKYFEQVNGTDFLLFQVWILKSKL